MKHRLWNVAYLLVVHLSLALCQTVKDLKWIFVRVPMWAKPFVWWVHQPLHKLGGLGVRLSLFLKYKQAEAHPDPAVLQRLEFEFPRSEMNRG